jgi:hypothetical protein
MSEIWVERRRACWAYSPGGHLAELRRATAGILFTDCFHITFAAGRACAAADHRLYHVAHPRRSAWRTLRAAWQTLRILLRERPALVLSTGADVAVPAIVLSKLLGATVVYVETAGSLEPSLAGRLAYPFADLFIVPWPEKLRSFPRAVLASGPPL